MILTFHVIMVATQLEVIISVRQFNNAVTDELKLLNRES